MDRSAAVAAAAVVGFGAGLSLARLWTRVKEKRVPGRPQKLTLKYFDLPSGGKGEPIRLALHYCGVPFDDYKFPNREEFGALKASGELLFGQVPALFVQDSDGATVQVLNQTPAILRYVAKVGGRELYPSDPVQAAVVDAIMDFEADMFMGPRVARYKGRFGFSESVLTPAACKEVDAAINAEVLPRHLASLEALLKKSSTGWLAGTLGPSIADFLFVPMIGLLLEGWSGDARVVAPFPELVKLKERFMAVREISAYYAAKK